MLLIAPALALALGTTPTSPDEDFLAARDAFRVGDAARLDKYAPRLKGYVLEPYVAYYQLRLRLEDASPAAVRGFLERHAGTLVADYLRAEWLKVLGKRGEWELFAAEYPKV
ncbi:MAG TPA: lytic transglycosylase domain-containing protein, partial [Burkholderiales bacterium]